MQKRQLGNSDMQVSVLALGAWAYGKVVRWAGEVEEKEIIDIVYRAVDSGINIIDTAAAYGESEEVVGKAVKGIRDKLYIATKCGANPEQIPGQIDNSLKKMDLGYIDLYQVHYPSTKIPIADTIGAMKKLKDEGKIRHIGVSNFSVEQLKEAIKVTEIVSCQSPYNLFWREIEEEGILEFCQKENVGILTYSSLAQGLLSGKFKSRTDLPTKEGEIRTVNVLFKKGIFEECLKTVNLVEETAQKYNKTPAEVSLNWVINQPGITSAVVGARNIFQLNDNVKAAGWNLNQQDTDILSQKGKEVSKLLNYAANMWGTEYPR
ncbi:MAG: aldo/keto reductase [Candidatus Omnitrophota bacterium]